MGNKGRKTDAHTYSSANTQGTVLWQKRGLDVRGWESKVLQQGTVLQTAAVGSLGETYWDLEFAKLARTCVLPDNGWRQAPQEGARTQQ